MNQSSFSENQTNYATRERNGSWKSDLNIGIIKGRWTIIAAAEGYAKNRQSRWLCKCQCGTERIVASSALRTGKSVSCGCYRDEYARTKSGENAKHWKGGRAINVQGYVTITKNGKRLLEHRIVMETHLGRPLYKGENVHHKNGVRADNRIENLELWISSQPSGQRPEDLIVWAEEILRRYKP